MGIDPTSGTPPVAYSVTAAPPASATVKKTNAVANEVLVEQRVAAPVDLDVENEAIIERKEEMIAAFARIREESGLSQLNKEAPKDLSAQQETVEKIMQFINQHFAP